MIHITVGIASFFVDLLEQMAWAGAEIAGAIVAGGLATVGCFRMARAARRRMRR